jgi:hypothetical protein
MGDGVTAPGLGGLWSASRSGRFTPGSPGNYCIGDCLSLPVWTPRKISTPPGLNTRTSQPLARRHDDTAIPATCVKYVQYISNKSANFQRAAVHWLGSMSSVEYSSFPVRDTVSYRARRAVPAAIPLWWLHICQCLQVHTNCTVCCL